MVNSLNINSDKYFIFWVILTKFADDIEQLYTNKYIVKYGYNNVRGGKYTNSTTLNRSKTYEDSDIQLVYLNPDYEDEIDVDYSGIDEAFDIS